MSLQQIVEQTVSGLGYDLVEIERSAGGLLRVTIDLPWAGPQEAAEEGEPTLPEQFITVEDCEKVNRQLQFALEVDAVDYRRLEISSPGIDRALRNDRDLLRFVGELVDITLRQPLGAAASSGSVNANRKKFRGRLEMPDGDENAAGDAELAATRWRIVWSDEPDRKPGQRVSRKRAPAPLQALDFTFSEVRDARLAPVIDFKGRRPRGNPAASELHNQGVERPTETGAQPHVQDRSDVA